MTSWGDGSVLLDLVERQFAHLLALTGSDRLLFLSRLLQFVENEPRLSGILEDLRHEADVALASFQAADEAIRKELASLWSAHETEILARLEPARAEDRAKRIMDVYCPLDSYEERLAAVPPAGFPARGNTAELEADTEKLITAMKQWQSWAGSEAEKTKEFLSDSLGRLGSIVEEVEREHRYAARTLHLASRTLGWPALERLRAFRALVQPAPPKRGTEVTPDSIIDFIRFSGADRAAQSIHGDGRARSTDHDRVAAMIDPIGIDAETLREELVLRIGLGRSRVALVRRYAARCEAFDAERLRSACADASNNAERILTLDFARFLYDAGLAPVLDATASGLRPDVLHVEPSSLFYVEAKQYNGNNPKHPLKTAYAQVWSTWGRLRKTYPCEEAFLVVFRRGGPYVELPWIIRWAGLRLYSVVADISTEAGSSEKSPVVRITEEDLRPPEESA